MRLCTLTHLAQVRSLRRQLSHFAENLGGNSQEVAAAASQVAIASQSLAEGASEQAASLEETSSSLEELASMTKRNADNSQQAHDLSKQTRAAADKGAADMLEMNTAMAAIKASSDDIAKIIKTIDEIAFQTNILALNAAVEAARAGEAGLSFAMYNEPSPLIGRDGELERVVQILCRRTKNNPVLIGEPGVGKTAIVEGLAQRIADGEIGRA